MVVVVVAGAAEAIVLKFPLGFFFDGGCIPPFY